MKDYKIHLMDEFRAGRMSRRELLRCASVAGFSLGMISGEQSAGPVLLKDKALQPLNPRKRDGKCRPGCFASLIRRYGLGLVYTRLSPIASHRGNRFTGFGQHLIEVPPVLACVPGQ